MADHHDDTPARSELHPLHLFLIPAGGLILGAGVLNLYYSFGWVGGDMNSDLAQIGFNGLDNIAALPMSSISIPLIAVGALMLIIANVTAWRETDGY